MPKYICVHGHFYQPPRMNPWLEAVEVQDSAAPYHDWNARVTAECYAPNVAARILGPKGTIAGIANNYQRMSFNFGPTLLSWLEGQAAEVYQAILEADAQSLKRWGHGNALAQVYNHIIMPLATRQDKLTQIKWGIKDFERRFNRPPEGMWLAETAVDTETLVCLAEEGVKFTILAPSQAAQVRGPEDKDWRDVGGAKVDIRRPYWAELPGGQAMTLFFYDGPASRAIAFEGLLKDGANLAARLKGLLDPKSDEPQLASIATDGESYGHHHRFGEMALAYALHALDEDPEVELINLGAYLEAHPPQWRARIVENSSWSCAHGVERWRSDCGCAANPGRGWNQKWRTPLREALDWLAGDLAALFEEQGAGLFNDPWAARDAYVETFLPQPESAWPAFEGRVKKGEWDQTQRVRAAKLLECQRWALFMFTSCGWFFDDIAGLEAVQNLRFAARAVQLAAELDGRDREQQLRGILAQAQSNQIKEGTGDDIWLRRVAPAKVGPRRVTAHAAIRGVMDEAPPPQALYCYQLNTKTHYHRQNLGLHVSWGRLEVIHRRLGEVIETAYAALYTGGHDFTAFVSPAAEAGSMEDLGQELEQPLRLMEEAALVEILKSRVDGASFSLGDLFLEGRRSLAHSMLRQTLAQNLETARSIYEANRDTMLFLRGIDVPLPGILSALAQAMITGDLAEGVKNSGPGPLPPEISQMAGRALALGVNIDSPGLKRIVEEALAEDLRAVAADPGHEDHAQHARELMDLSETLHLQVDLWEAQNIFDHLLGQEKAGDLPEQVRELGRRLGFEME